MKITLSPKPENENRLTVSWQHKHMKALLDGRVEEIIIKKSDETITIPKEKFCELRFDLKSPNFWIANYSRCV